MSPDQQVMRAAQSEAMAQGLLDMRQAKDKGLDDAAAHAPRSNSPTNFRCVGHRAALDMAFGAVRDGGTISRVGAPQYTEGPMGFEPMFRRNLTLTGGLAPTRAYVEELLPDVLEGKVEPGRVFDRSVSLDEVPDGYRAMAAREALKVLIQP